MNFEVKNSRILCEGGLPCPERWFADGRVAFGADNEGLCDIDYFGRSEGSYIAMHKRFWGGLRYTTVDAEMHRRRISPERTVTFPFGFLSEGRVGMRVFAAEDAVFLTFTVFERCRVELHLYEEYLFHPETRHPDIRYRGGERSFTPFVMEGGRFTTSYTEHGDTTQIAISSTLPFTVRETTHNKKYILSTELLSAGDAVTFAIGFSDGVPTDASRAEDAFAAQSARYEAIAKRAPVLHSDYPMLDAFMALAPMYHESMKLHDVRGAIRAQITRYFVWGWDTMTSHEAPFYWGDADFMREMLSFLCDYADPEHGIAHHFSRRMKCIDVAAPAAQGMYLCILNTYRLSGGDITPFYPFAVRVLDTILATANGDGLCTGTSLYPDYRDLLHENDRDISAFNNSVSYAALRAIEECAVAMQDEKTAALAKETADKCKASFTRVLFDESVGFYDSSVSADDLSHRHVPGNNAIKWESRACADLFLGKEDACLDFYRAHLVSPSGLRPYPEWCDVYDSDANQLTCWWPVMSEFYTRLLNRAGDRDGMRQYIGWLSYWTERLTCPEGIQCFFNEAEPPADNWNSLSGICNAYSIRGFYNAIVHNLVGVDFDNQGLHIHPMRGECLTLNNLHFGKYCFDISVEWGDADGVILNGVPLLDGKVIPFASMAEKNTLRVIRRR